MCVCTGLQKEMGIEKCVQAHGECMEKVADVCLHRGVQRDGFGHICKCMDKPVNSRGLFTLAYTHVCNPTSLHIDMQTPSSKHPFVCDHECNSTPLLTPMHIRTCETLSSFTTMCTHTLVQLHPLAHSYAHTHVCNPIFLPIHVHLHTCAPSCPICTPTCTHHLA